MWRFRQLVCMCLAGGFRRRRIGADSKDAPRAEPVEMDAAGFACRLQKGGGYCAAAERAKR